MSVVGRVFQRERRLDQGTGNCQCGLRRHGDPRLCPQLLQAESFLNCYREPWQSSAPRTASLSHLETGTLLSIATGLPTLSSLSPISEAFWRGY